MYLSQVRWSRKFLKEDTEGVIFFYLFSPKNQGVSAIQSLKH